MTTNVVSALAQKNRAFLNRAKPQRIGRGGVAGLSFDGVNDFVSLPNIPNLAGVQGSIAVILRLNGYNASPNFRKIAGLANEGYGFNFSNSTTFRFFANASFFNATLNTNTTSVYYLFIVYKNPNIDLYLYNLNNNQLQTASISVNIVLTSSAPFYLGNVTGADTLVKGDIYDFKFFTKALSVYEVRELFFKKGDVNGNFAGGSLFADYRFDNFQSLASLVAADSTANGNNGTLVNYTAGDLTAGSGCKIIDRFGNPIRN